MLEEVEAEDGSSRAHAACFEALINAGADVDQWDGEGLAPIHHAKERRGLRAVLVRFVFVSCFPSASRVSRPIGCGGGARRVSSSGSTPSLVERASGAGGYR